LRGKQAIEMPAGTRAMQFSVRIVLGGN
jgi:hypothetical protein